MALRFEVPEKGRAKYRAVFADGRPSVEFGDRRYQQYHDSVPESMGGGKWSHLNHGDEKRRERYRARAGKQRTADGELAISHPGSAAWFSYWFLW